MEFLPVLTTNESAEFQLEGIIDRFVSATDFGVQQQPVSTNSGTIWIDGDAQSLGPSVKVEALGAIDANGILQASQITIKPTEAVRIEANVEAIELSANTVTVLGVTITIRELTEF